jgi:hypothetical protein
VVDGRGVEMRRVHKLNLHLHSQKKKTISERKKEKKTKMSTSNKKFIVSNYYKKRGYTIDSCWYTDTCSFCGNKDHCEVASWKKQAMFWPNCFQNLNGKVWRVKSTGGEEIPASPIKGGRCFPESCNNTRGHPQQRSK